MNIEIKMTDNTNPDFVKLIKLLDEDLVSRYGESQKQYDKHNKVDKIKDVTVIYADNIPAGCGAFKKFNDNTVEIKRVYVGNEFRGRGFSRIILKRLETEALSQGYCYAVLETGNEQQEAIGLYQSSGYEIIPNYEPYVGLETSICMRRVLR
ncbi:GNAT family N-acetyltransferase [Anaerocolumna sp. AGMB13020]|uniref:GNAT family N-acetyltransferase n=1 Tax=Anaerocolumna sp. AGMB13020 TaxID=3081750 RepID=UPI002952CB45|nr:GNAT family N-acetyltransferase [Anaerocolumna sp. AGMB13020]WOO35939.1 GNAT family N-acetyltransferase [Anaerocolumna sp. AGMB13020]